MTNCLKGKPYKIPNYLNIHNCNIGLIIEESNMTHKIKCISTCNNTKFLERYYKVIHVRGKIPCACKMNG